MEVTSTATTNTHDKYIAAIQAGVKTFAGVPQELRDDVDFVRRVVKVRPRVARSSAFNRALFNDMDLLRAITSVDAGIVFSFDMPPTMYDDDEVMLNVVSRFPHELKQASPRIRQDRNIVLAAIKCHDSAMRYAADSLKNDIEFMKDAVRLNLMAAPHVPAAMQCDREAVLALVRVDGMALFAMQHTQRDPPMRHDIELELEACKSNGRSLQHIRKTVRDRSDVQLAAATARRSPNKPILKMMLKNVYEDVMKLFFPWMYEDFVCDPPVVSKTAIDSVTNRLNEIAVAVEKGKHNIDAYTVRATNERIATIERLLGHIDFNPCILSEFQADMHVEAREAKRGYPMDAADSDAKRVRHARADP
jgi:hypothetical protein